MTNSFNTFWQNKIDLIDFHELCEYLKVQILPMEDGAVCLLINY